MTPIYILAVYMLSYMLIETDGPYGMFYKLRHETEWEALKCFPCTSVWVGFLIAIVPADNFINWLIWGLALAGAATLIDSLIERVWRGE